MKTQKFASISAVPTNTIELVRQEIIITGGDNLLPISITFNHDYLGQPFLKFLSAMLNTSTDPTAVFWTGPITRDANGNVVEDDVYAPPSPTATTPGLKGLYSLEVQDKTGGSIAKLTPILYGFGDTVALDGTDPSSFHPWSFENGFALSPGWADRTRVAVPCPELADADYIGILTLDPANRWGQQSVLTIPFTVAGGVVTNVSLKVTGKH